MLPAPDPHPCKAHCAALRGAIAAHNGGGEAPAEGSEGGAGGCYGCARASLGSAMALLARLAAAGPAWRDALSRCGQEGGLARTLLGLLPAVPRGAARTATRRALAELAASDKGASEAICAAVGSKVSTLAARPRAPRPCRHTRLRNAVFRGKQLESDMDRTFGAVQL